MPYTKAIGVDFDGVIHTYGQGWQGGEIYGELMPGAAESLRTLMETYAVFIHTTRDPHTVAPWMAERGFPAEADEDPTRNFWSTQGVLLVTQKKLVAIAFIDDRAIPFRTWDQAMTEVGKLY
ncbi:hypothetical protein ACFV16_22270 [Streptomyces massasporeus]|uniref:hypothetical protein n=1 Tax=Streptomyces massasporeus TaxID=67324 RepID=UPI0036A90724